MDLLLESHVCCVNQKFTSYFFHRDFNTSIYTLNDFFLNDFRLWCTVIHSFGPLVSFKKTAENNLATNVFFTSYYVLTFFTIVYFFAFYYFTLIHLLTFNY